VTDSGGEVRATVEKPGIANLLSIFSAVAGRSVPDLENDFAGKGYGDFKRAAADAVIARLEPVRLRYEEFSKDTAYLDSVLKSGAEAAQHLAYKTLSKVYRKVGFVERPR
jgi:tryptophanyl-tRNA synthetase